MKISMDFVFVDMINLFGMGKNVFHVIHRIILILTNSFASAVIQMNTMTYQRILVCLPTAQVVLFLIIKQKNVYVLGTLHKKQMVLVDNALKVKFITKDQKSVSNAQMEVIIILIKLIASVIQRNRHIHIFLINASVLIQGHYYPKVNACRVMDTLMLLQGHVYHVQNHRIW